MATQKTVSLSTEAWNSIAAHARDAFPDECCGIVSSNGATDQIHRLKNIQNRLHELDPQTYPRTAAIAYAMDYKELEAAIDNVERSGAKLKAFYHSHPDHEAYFSDEDKAFACPFGEPTFPDTAQIVVSLYDRIVKRIAAFVWSFDEKDFVEVPLAKPDA